MRSIGKCPAADCQSVGKTDLPRNLGLMPKVVTDTCCFCLLATAPFHVGYNLSARIYFCAVILFASLLTNAKDVRPGFAAPSLGKVQGPTA